MSTSFGPDRNPFRSRTDATNASHGARAEYIRIARALLGVTPAQLASQIGASAPPRLSEATRPTRTLDRLSDALQAVIGWYHTSLENEPTAQASQSDTHPQNLDNESLGLDTLVHEYLALRSKWENREAGRIAARLTDTATPRSETGSVPTKPTSIDPVTARRTALLVDDATDVLVTVSAFLEACGFDVLRASSGDEALQILATGAEIDLLVTDDVMPGMTGKDLVVQACQLHPTLRALIITGYAENAELVDLPPHVLLLAKPFRRKMLQDLIRQLFDANQNAGSLNVFETRSK